MDGREGGKPGGPLYIPYPRRGSSSRCRTSGDAWPCSPADFCSALPCESTRRNSGCTASSRHESCTRAICLTQAQRLKTFTPLLSLPSTSDSEMSQYVIDWWVGTTIFSWFAAEGLRTGGGPALVGAQPMPKALRQPHKCSVDCVHHRCLLLGHNSTSGRGDISGITR
nr:PREDICTED: uncharacterized protein LOC108952511 [Musa acuminata subsp. malaccensis]